MAFLDLFKVNTERKKLDVPMAPGSVESRKLPSLPEFPEMDDIEAFEKKEMRKQDKEIKQREVLELKEPLFVEVSMYKAMLDEATQSANILKDDEEICLRLDDFEMDFDKEYAKFQKSLEDIQRKLIFCDKTLFK